MRTIRDPPAGRRCTLESVADKHNLRRAFEHVKRSRMGKRLTPAKRRKMEAAFLRLAEQVGQDGKQGLAHVLRSANYKPVPVAGVDIPKDNGKTRRLGIPRLNDQVAQQAVLQVLSPLLDPTFSSSSYGYRPRKAALDAIVAMRESIRAGYLYVVDLDIEAFFDAVNHEILMDLVAQHADEKLRALIQRFLNAGMVLDRKFIPRVTGTPQGSPLSPLLANLYLDPFDRHLTHQGIPFARYADDIRIFCRSSEEARRLLEVSARFLANELKLNVNATKSRSCRVEESTFLGYTFERDGTPRVASAKLKKAVERCIGLTHDRYLVNATERIVAINQYVAAWSAYFRLAAPDNDALRTMDNELFRAFREAHPSFVQRIVGVIPDSAHRPDLLLGLGIKGFLYRANPSASGCPEGNGERTAHQRGVA